MDAPVHRWLKENLTQTDFQGKTVLEVGSQDFNGTPRGLIQRLGPARYLGVDFMPGKGVDRVVDAKDLVATFGEEAFDAVVSTEMLEHVEDWRTAIHEMKRVLRSGGTLVLTTRRPGFEQHGYPHDHWRFTVPNLRAMFVDFWITRVEAINGQGVVLMARKPYAWEAPASLDHIHPAKCPAKPYRGFRRLIWVKTAYRFQDPAAPRA